MTIKILASLAIAATVFTACGDDSTTSAPTKAEQCAAGLSNDCITGTWSINGPTESRLVGTDIVYIIDPGHDLTANPATIKFYTNYKGENLFEYTLSPLSQAICELTKTYGNWEIAGTSLTLTATTNTTCMVGGDRITLTPKISTAGGKITMTFEKLFFMRPEYGAEASNDEVQNKTEVYNFVSAE